ncbi:MAG: hypothetical protein J1F35_01835 [Erysipelotrichales bacterium]|nr:hypothetical protein [Erysipelotrichales bacterium]
MKNRYERLTRQEKHEAIEEYKNSNEHNKALYTRLTRLRGIGIIGIIYSILMFTLDFLKEQGIFDYGFNTFGNVVLNYIIDAVLLILCFVFVLKAHQLLKEQVNKYLIEKMKTKEEKKKK